MASTEAPPTPNASTPANGRNGTQASAPAAPTAAIDAGNVDYLDSLYQQFRRDPDAVDPTWRAFFQGVDFAGGVLPDGATLPGPGEDGGAVIHHPHHPAARGEHVSRAPHTGPEAMPLTLGVYDLVHTFREFGHFSAEIDPLGRRDTENPFLDLSNFGITDADLPRRVGVGGFLGETDGTLGDLLDKLRQTYCSTIGIELNGVNDKAQRDWLTGRLEPGYGQPSLDDDEKRWLLRQLVDAEEMEQYLGRVFKSSKRFSVEGAESLVPLLNMVADHAPRYGADALVLTMAHRGRLNVLAHVMGKPYEVLLGEFKGTNKLPTGVDGDVKYHLGYARERDTPHGKVKVSLLPNPSHLELVNPIQQGIVRCKQEFIADGDRTKIVPVTIHGDAAFVGQGIVAETLNLSELAGYETGGTIHVITNNQIGFTTPPVQGRFTPYATDIAKTIGAPVFHVNGDDPEAVAYVAKLAIEYRQTFQQDVILDLYCYRRHGHNEQDEPRFTQPLMYAAIDAQPTTRELYEKKLTASGVVSDADAAAMKDEVIAQLDAARERAEVQKVREHVPSFSGVWNGLEKAPPFPDGWNPDTSVPGEVLAGIVERAYDLPDGFKPHPKLQKFVIDARRKMLKTRKGIDFGCAEMLAFGSLLMTGTNIRFTGQDVERGTFAHRHAVLHDVETGEPFTPLCSMGNGQADFEIRNSMLSELAVLGFEWGYASADPRNLVIWEAQFGDFVNGAQALIDQILASAESKWQYMNGLTLLLPHGYEGAGPEHSNAYLERWLNLSAENNMQVVAPTTAGQHFHLFRRQMVRSFRKPLIVMSPKSLLRAPAAQSELSELTDHGFRMVIDDPRDSLTGGGGKVRRVLLCSGKVYHTLAKALADGEVNDIAAVRVEQLYPMPCDALGEVLKKYPDAEMVWVQEEPKNRGPWRYTEHKLRDTLGLDLRYVGRPPAASPAVGSLDKHKEEEAKFVAEALA